MCEPAVLHHVAGHHEAFGRSFAHHEHHGYGTKRSGRAFVCTARHARVRRCQCGRARNTAEPEILFEVSRGKSSMPAPDADSAVIQLRIRRKNRPWMCTMKHFSSALFALRSHSAAKRPSIPASNTLHMSKQQVTDAFEQAGDSGKFPRRSTHAAGVCRCLSISLPIKEMLL